jgi:parvulin-like peptidyl-prolyl isomerase
LTNITQTYKHIVNVLLIAVCLIVSSAKANAGDINDLDTVAMVGSNPVLYGEFNLIAMQKRSEIIRLYRNKYKLNYDANFWQTKVDGMTPDEALKKSVMDTLISIKAQQIIALELGLVDQISFSYFLNALEEENHRRHEAKNNNQVIYGPVTYSPTIYYNYIFSNMVLRLKETLAVKQFKITDHVLKCIYEADKDAYYTQGEVIKFKLIRLKSDDQSTVEHVKSGLQQNKSIEELKRKGFIADCESKTLDDSEYKREEDEGLPVLIEKEVRKLNLGQVSDLIKTGSNYFLVMPEDKRSLGFRDFEECKQYIRSKYINELYIGFIDQKIANSKIQLL